MTGNDTPLRHGILIGTATAGSIFFLGFSLMMAESSQIVTAIAFFCPWVVLQYGSDSLIILTSAVIIGLLAGFLAWLRRTLDEMRSSYERTISELKTRVGTLEKKLNTITKD